MILRFGVRQHYAVDLQSNNLPFSTISATPSPFSMMSKSSHKENNLVGGGGGEGYRALYASARSSPVQDMSFRRGLSYGPPGRIRGLLTAGSVALRLGTNGGRLGVSPAPYDSQWAALLHGTCAPPPAVRVRRNGEWRGGGIIMALLRTCISCRSMHLARGCRDVV